MDISSWISFFKKEFDGYSIEVIHPYFGRIYEGGFDGLEEHKDLIIEEISFDLDNTRIRIIVEDNIPDDDWGEVEE